MNTSQQNPFSNRAAIADPAYFFGRRTLVREVTSLLANGQSVAIIGSSKIGKSSLIAHVSREATLRSCGVDPGRFAFCRMSFGGLDKLTQDQFFALMLSTLAGQNPGRVATGRELDDQLDFADLLRRLRPIAAGGTQVVFAFDEFELSARNPNFDFSFLAGLRALASELGVSFVTATQRHLHEEQLTKMFLGSPFYNILQTVPVGLFSSDEAEKMAATLGSGAGVDMGAHVEPMREIAGLHPYFLQVLAYYVFEEKRSGRDLDAGGWERAKRRFKEETESQFEALWSFLWDEEKAALGHIADGNAAEVDLETLKRLRQLSFTVEKDPSRIELFSGAFKEFIQSRHASYPNIVALVRALEAKDRYTSGHSDGVARAALAIARELQVDQETVEQLRIAARLHDIGKIGIPDEVLLCRGSLDNTDWDTMRRHPIIGAEIISALRLPSSVTEFVRGHQERLDGSGYPDSLTADKLAMGTRILMVADVYNALTTPRVYRGGQFFSPEEALRILREGAGTEFDESIIDAVGRLLARRVGIV